MIPKYAFKILVDGFKTGAFIGKKISDYIYTDKKTVEEIKNYVAARRCINGEDRKDLIAGYAKLFEALLTN